MHLNLPFNAILLPTDEYFGGQTKDGNWTGLVGMVARNEADMGAVDLFFTSERHRVVDFCGPFMVEASPVIDVHCSHAETQNKANICENQICVCYYKPKILLLIYLN